jgi:molecular chaperone DnaJ
MAPQREWFEKNYYSVLGVGSEAPEKDITRAYRKLAKQYHPDANPGDSAAEERFKDVSAAYDVLGDADKRKEYDEVRRMVAAGVGPGGFGGPGGFQGNVRFEDLGDMGGLGDILGGLFGRGARRRGRQAAGPRRGRDLETELHLDFLDAVRGITTTVSFTAEAACSECAGTGAKRGTIPDICPTCQGTGTIADDQGPFSFSEVCPTCGGRGQVITDPCPKCKGSGVEVRRRDVKVRIPAGVRDGQRIRVAGRGAPGMNGGPPGDLYVVVHVGQHPVFGRDPKNPKNLTVTVPITFAEAALGATVRVPTLDEPVTVKVPAGTQSGKTVRVRGKGIAPAKGNAGDLLVRFEVAVPKKLGSEERKAVEALGETLTANPREHLGV